MLTHCLKDKRMTGCVGGELITTKNNRLMLKCRCAECGMTKCRFLPPTTRSRF